MSSVPEVAQAMRRVLTEVARQAAADSGLVQRRSKLTGPGLVQTLVFGWLADPDASLSALTQMAATLGVAISPQALFQRFTPRAVECLRQVLEAAVAEVMAAEPVAVPVLQRFSAVLVQDSSVIMLPDTLREVWAGCGGSGSYGQSALKLQVRLDLTAGQMLGPFLTAGRTPDSDSPVQREPIPAGALRIADLGYYRLDTFRELAEQRGYFLSRYKAGTKLYRHDGTELDLERLLTTASATAIDRPALLGRAHRLPVRLLAAKAPPEVSAQRRRRLKDQARKKQQRQPGKARLALCDWNSYVTNVPPPCSAGMRQWLWQGRAGRLNCSSSCGSSTAALTAGVRTIPGGYSARSMPNWWPWSSCTGLCSLRSGCTRTAAWSRPRIRSAATP